MVCETNRGVCRVSARDHPVTALVASLSLMMRIVNVTVSSGDGSERDTQLIEMQ